MKNNFPKILFFFSIIFFLLSLVAFLFFYRTINFRNQQSQLKEEKWQIEANRREGIKMLNNSVKMVTEEKTKLESHFAQSSDIVPFLDTVETLAAKVEVKAEITSVDIAEDHSGLTIGVKTSGTFSGLYKFLTLLENSPYELKFVGMDMKRESILDSSGKNIATAKWNATFRIKLLSFIN